MQRRKGWGSTLNLGNQRNLNPSNTCSSLSVPQPHFWGTNRLRFDWFVPKAGLRFYKGQLTRKSPTTPSRLKCYFFIFDMTTRGSTTLPPTRGWQWSSTTCGGGRGSRGSPSASPFRCSWSIFTPSSRTGAATRRCGGCCVRAWGWGWRRGAGGRSVEGGHWGHRQP